MPTVTAILLPLIKTSFKDVTPPVKPTLADVTAECSTSPTAPTTTDNCAGTVTGTTSTTFPITTQGTTIVTWSFADGNGNSVTANQNVIIKDVTPPVKPILADVTAECSATPTAPTTTDNCAGTVTGTTSTTFPITTQGTTIVTWTFADGNGNSVTANQNIIIKDVTPPVKPTLADVTAECSTSPTAPTTTDNCAGTVTGTTSTTFPITTQGTTIVTWTFADGNGNSVTANQNIIIKDVTPPVKPTLADVTAECSATPTAPTTTDNCTGTVTGTTSTTFPITTQGTTVVIWTFSDGNGNSITANQNVIIKDITKPTAKCITSSPSILLNRQGTITLSAIAIDNGSTDNCTASNLLQFSLDKSTFMYSDIGTQTVTLTITDLAGNHSSCNASIVIGVPANTPILLTSKVILQGPYDATTGLMNDALRTLPSFPLISPYGTKDTLLATIYSPRDTLKTPSILTGVTSPYAIVDWVKVELRDANSPSTVLFTRNAFVLRNGSVVDTDGVSPVAFYNVPYPIPKYYLALRHRNHLGAMSKNALTFAYNSQTNFDFTADPINGTNALINIPGNFPTNAMYAGDADGNGTINAIDRSTTWNNRNKTGYLLNDINMNGTVDATDRSQTWNNRNKTSSF